MASVTFYVGFFHLLIYPRQRLERQHLTLALTCAMMGLYDVFSAGLYNATTAAQGVHWQRAQVAALALLSITFPWFVVDYFARISPLSSRTKKWIGAFSVYFALAAVVGMLDHSGLVRPLDRPAVKEIQLLWGDQIVYYEMEPGPLTNLQSMMGLILFIYILWLSVGIHQKGHPEARPLLGALILFFVAVLNDTAVAMGLYPFVYVMEYAYMGMVLLMTHALTGAVVEAAVIKETLREREEQYRTLFESSPEPITLVGLNGAILDCNDATAKLAGFPRSEIVGKPFTQLGILTEGDAAKYLELFTQIINKEKITPVELEIVRSDEERRRLEAFTAPLEKDGVLHAIQVITRDVTERVRAEAALRVSEEQHRQVVQNANEAIVVTQDGMLKLFNAKALEITGYSREELTTIPFVELVHPDDREMVIRRHLTRLRGEQVANTYNFRIIDKAGNTKWVEINVVLMNWGGRPATLNFISDITERKRAEEKILRLQHLLQNITDSMPSALIALDLEGRVLTWNPTAQTLTGQTAGQVQGQPLWQVCPELTRYQDLFDQVVREGQVTQRHREQLTTESSTVYHDVSIFPLQANDIEGVVLRIDDVTRRVQLEEMMLQSAKMASLGGLAAGVAHEINNPLGAVMQSAQVLRLALDTQRPHTRERLEHLGIDPDRLEIYLHERKVVDYLEGIRTTGARAAKIVTDLLGFSRKTTSHAAPHDMNALVEQTLELAAIDYDLKKKYDFRDIQIVRELAPHLPPLICDSQQIQQVLLNLVRNAAQAMAGKTGRADTDSAYRPRLTLRTRHQDEWIRLEIEDNGSGIPDYIRGRLFEPFFTAKQVGEGTGLGLWLCWSIVVERHKGRIWAEPGAEGGARFVVELPFLKLRHSVFR